VIRGARAWLQSSIVFVTATAGAVVCGGYVEAALHPRPRFETAADGTLKLIAPQGDSHRTDAQPAYFRLEPPLVAAVTDHGQQRLLELHVTIRGRGDEAVANVKLHEPAITSGLLNLLYGRDLWSLEGREGREALRRECLREVLRVLATEGAADGVDDLYFTELFFQ
jgi:flagellar basal body-associated protein FliL